MKTQITRTKDGIYGLGIVLVTMLLGAGCSKNSSDPVYEKTLNQEKASLAGFMGTWTPKNLLDSQNSIENEGGTQKAKVGHQFLNISSELVAQFESLGTYHNHQRLLETRLQSIGRLKTKVTRQAHLLISDEYKKELKQEGASDDVIKAWSSCLLTLKSASEMDLTCPDQPGDNKSTLFVKLSSEDRQKMQDETHRVVKSIVAQRTELLKVLAGKNFKWQSGEVKTIDKDGKELSLLIKPEELPDDSGADGNLAINPKRLVFSDNLYGAKINEKWEAQVDVSVTADLSAAILDVRWLTPENKYLSPIYGAIVLEQNAFSVTYETVDKETQTKSIVTKVFVMVD